jgi:hypothetical protein
MWSDRAIFFSRRKNEHYFQSLRLGVGLLSPSPSSEKFKMPQTRLSVDVFGFVPHSDLRAPGKIGWTRIAYRKQIQAKKLRNTHVIA